MRMNTEEQRATMTIRQFANLMGFSPSLAYQLARRDQLPVRVIHLGSRRMVVSRAAVERLLHTNEGSQEREPQGRDE